MSIQSTKPFSQYDANQVLQKSALNDGTLSVNGFVNSKVGAKITRTDVDSVTEDYRFLDVINTVSGTTVNTSPIITFANDINVLDFAVVGQYLYGTGIPANAKILTVDSNNQITMDTNATASGTVDIKFANLLCKLRIVYDNSDHDNVNDIERME